MTASGAKRLAVKQVKSVIGQRDSVRKTVSGLGLSGPGTSVVVANSPSFRGAIKKVIHLVQVNEVQE